MELQSCTVYNHPPSPRCTMYYTKQNFHQTFLNTRYQTISNTAFLSLMPEQNQNTPNYTGKKIKREKLSHPWESKKAREI